MDLHGMLAHIPRVQYMPYTKNKYIWCYFHHEGNTKGWKQRYGSGAPFYYCVTQHIYRAILRIPQPWNQKIQRPLFPKNEASTKEHSYNAIKLEVEAAPWPIMAAHDYKSMEKRVTKLANII